MKSNPILLALLVGATAFSAGSTRADVVRFVEGTILDVPVTIEGSSIRFDTPMGEYTYPRSDVAKIEPSSQPERDWAARRDRAMKGGASERLAASLWALDFGLVSEARATLKAARSADPAHPSVRRMCLAIDRLEASLSDPDLAPLLRSSPADHRITRGPHVLLIHQHSDAEANERVALLEDVIFGYYLYLASLGLELPPPRERLPSIWFARKADYVAFLRDEGADAFLSTRGYHHPTRGLVATYDCGDDAPRVTARKAITSRRDELDKFSAQAARIPPRARVRVSLQGVAPRSMTRDQAMQLDGQLRRQVDRQQVLLELTRRSLDWGVAAHETIHQLVSSSRLAPRQDAFPHWLHEGLAMQFETIRAGRWAGLGPPSPLRLRDYHELKSPPSLARTLSDSGFGRGYTAESYARAWSLVYYLRSESPSTFVGLLDGLRLPVLEPEDAPSRALRLVRSRIGEDLSSEEARWRHFLVSLPSPVESRLSPDHSD